MRDIRSTNPLEDMGVCPVTLFRVEPRTEPMAPSMFMGMKLPLLPWRTRILTNPHHFRGRKSPPTTPDSKIPTLGIIFKKEGMIFPNDAIIEL